MLTCAIQKMERRVVTRSVRCSLHGVLLFLIEGLTRYIMYEIGLHNRACSGLFQQPLWYHRCPLYGNVIKSRYLESVFRSYIVFARVIFSVVGDHYGFTYKSFGHQTRPQILLEFQFLIGFPRHVANCPPVSPFNLSSMLSTLII